ncbi:MAG: hypothetical protein ACTS6P_00920 [Candidatus Hodgkinia cicadicola]
MTCLEEIIETLLPHPARHYLSTFTFEGDPCAQHLRLALAIKRRLKCGGAR